MTERLRGDELLASEEVADYLGLALQTVQRWAKSDRLPALKVGKDYRFRPADIARFLEESRVAPGTLSHLYPPPRSLRP